MRLKSKKPLLEIDMPFNQACKVALRIFAILKEGELCNLLDLERKGMYILSFDARSFGIILHHPCHFSFEIRLRG